MGCKGRLAAYITHENSDGSAEGLFLFGGFTDMLGIK